jgi:hypothetical protein
MPSGAGDCTASADITPVVDDIAVATDTQPVVVDCGVIIELMTLLIIIVVPHQSFPKFIYGIGGVMPRHSG